LRRRAELGNKNCSARTTSVLTAATTTESTTSGRVIDELDTVFEAAPTAGVQLTLGTLLE